MSLNDIFGAIKANSRSIAIGGTSALLGAGLGYMAGRKSSTKKSRSRKSKRKVMYRKNRIYRKKAKKQMQPHTAGKRRDTSMRRIRFTKNNQPYIILASGKAKFISKKSAKMSRKRSGGRY